MKDNEYIKNYDTPLTLECKKGNINEVIKLIENSNNLNKRNKYGDTPLIIACKKRNHELVECLLKFKNIEIDKKSKYGINPLMVACYFQDKNLVNYLIDNKAKIEIYDTEYKSPLDIVSSLKNNEIIQLLKKEDIDLSKNSFTEKPNDIRRDTNNGENSKQKENKTESETDDSDSDNYDYNGNLNEMAIADNTMEDLEVFHDQISCSICYIKKDKFYGTGFFIEIPIPSEKHPMRGIMTNNHILLENSLKQGKTFNIYMANNDEQAIEIQINEDIFAFTSELIDVTFVEIPDEIIKKIKPHFLKPSKKDAKVNESILLFQYPEQSFSFAHGTITGSQSFNYFHNISTGSGSGGSPLLNEEHEFVGIHKSKKYFRNNDMIKNSGEKVAIKYSTIEYAIKILYYDYLLNETERAKQSSRELNEEELNVLREYGLNLELKLISNDDIEVIKRKISRYEMKLLKKNLFSCNISKNNLLFYRTNYAWYVTILDEEIDISEYSFDYLKQLDWSLIDPYTEKFDKKIIDKIDGREYVLLTWLKLTELMYL